MSKKIFRDFHNINERFYKGMTYIYAVLSLKVWF